MTMKARTRPSTKKNAKARAKANAKAKPVANAKPNAKAKAKPVAPRLRDVMTTEAFTLTAGQTASDAWALMRTEDVKHAIVLGGTSVVGLLSDRDLGGPNGAAVRRGKTVGDLMDEAPVLAKADLSVADAVELFGDRRLECLPVVAGKRLVGVVTRSDLLRLLAPAKGRRRARTAGAADVPRPPRVASPNADKRP